MEETLRSTNTYTKQQWIAEQARVHPDRVFRSDRMRPDTSFGLRPISPVTRGAYSDPASASRTFRPGRSAHDALYALRTGIMERGQRSVFGSSSTTRMGVCSGPPRGAGRPAGTRPAAAPSPARPPAV